MRILVVCQYYYPEPFRIHEVCAELVKRGHDVTVLTGLPNYPMGIIPEEYQNGRRREEYINGVHVIRCFEIPRGKGKVALAKNYVSYVLSASIKALTMKKRFDVIFVYQLSPVLMAIPAYVAKWFSRTKNISIYCLDLWPESLTSMGISKDSAFYKLIKWVSIRIYKGAYSIGYTSRMFKKYFNNELGIFDKKFKHIPQFADELFTEISSNNSQGEAKIPTYSAEASMAPREINYVFAGNIGEMQSVETIIKAAALVTDERIKWHIVGDGSKYEDCKDLASKLGILDRVTFYGRLPVEEMPRFYSMADAMIVTLANNDTISYTLPGKVQSYMAAGKACIASASGETKIVIEDAKCGKCALPEDERDLARVAEEMARSDMKEYGKCARKYYDDNYSKKNHIDLIEEMLKRTVKGK